MQGELYGDTDDDWASFIEELHSALHHSDWVVHHVEVSPERRMARAESAVQGGGVMELRAAEKATTPYRFRLAGDHIGYGCWNELLIKELLASGAQPIGECCCKPEWVTGGSAGLPPNGTSLEVDGAPPLSEGAAAEQTTRPAPKRKAKKMYSLFVSY